MKPWIFITCPMQNSGQFSSFCVAYEKVMDWSLYKKPGAFRKLEKNKTNSLKRTIQYDFIALYFS